MKNFRLKVGSVLRLAFESDTTFEDSIAYDKLNGGALCRFNELIALLQQDGRLTFDEIDVLESVIPCSCDFFAYWLDEVL